MPEQGVVDNAEPTGVWQQLGRLDSGNPELSC